MTSYRRANQARRAVEAGQPDLTGEALTPRGRAWLAKLARQRAMAGLGPFIDSSRPVDLDHPKPITKRGQ